MTRDDIKRHLHALHNICRFNGHVARHYSVAEHTAIGLEVMQRDSVDIRYQRFFALHDLPEAVLGLGDLARDVKRDPEVAAIYVPREEDALAHMIVAVDADIISVPYNTAVEIVQKYDRLMAVAEVEAVALVEHDSPDDYDPFIHGYAARRIWEGASAGRRARLYPHFTRLFGGSWD